MTLESAVYISMKNDIALMLTGTISLYEHQSTWNPNMPIRFLIYLAEEYQKFIELSEESLYGTKRILLPASQCVVFYNGEKNMPEEQMMKLSDAFINKAAKADVELRVRVININYGHNEALMEQCSNRILYRTRYPERFSEKIPSGGVGNAVGRNCPIVRFIGGANQTCFKYSIG